MADGLTQFLGAFFKTSQKQKRSLRGGYDDPGFANL